MVFEEGLSIGIYSPKIFGHGAMIVAALRARRVQNNSNVTLEFDNKERIRPITEQIVAVEIHKPTYLTHGGTVSIGSVFQGVCDSLRGQEIRVDKAASRLQSAVQERIVDNLNVPQELSEFEADFLLAAPMKNPNLMVEEIIKDNELASLTVRGKLLDSGEKFYTVLTLPAIRFMVAGLNFSKGKTKPDTIDVSVPGKLKRISLESDSDDSWCMLHTDMYNEVRFDRFRQHLNAISPPVPLGLEEATKLVSDFITPDIRETLKLELDHPIPTEVKILRL